MDESALKILLARLETSRSSLDSWLFWATFLVVVGVALEWVFVIWEYREGLQDWQRGIVHPPDKPNVWLLVLGLLGTSLVTIGVAGELYIGAKIGAVETSIRKANDDRATLLSKEAGDAKMSATGAADAATVANKQAGLAKDEADAASKLANNVRDKAKQIVEALKQPEFDDAEIKALADRLNKCPRHQKKVVVIGAMFNPATLSVWRALTLAGFNSEPPTLTAYTWDGSWVEAPSDIDGATGGCIQQAIGDSHKLALTLFKPLYSSSDPIRVIVGLNPVGKLPDFARPKTKTK